MFWSVQDIKIARIVQLSLLWKEGFQSFQSGKNDGRVQNEVFYGNKMLKHFLLTPWIFFECTSLWLGIRSWMQDVLLLGRLCAAQLCICPQASFLKTVQFGHVSSFWLQNWIHLYLIAYKETFFLCFGHLLFVFFMSYSFFILHLLH